MDKGGMGDFYLVLFVAASVTFFFIAHLAIGQEYKSERGKVQTKLIQGSLA